MKKIKRLFKQHEAKRVQKVDRASAQRESALQNLLYDDHGGAIIGRREDRPRY